MEDSDPKDNPLPGTSQGDEGAAEGSSTGGNEGAAEGSSTGGFEVTADRLEQLMKSMEVLLWDVEQLRAGCSHQAEELVASVTELRRQQEDLKESYAGLGRDMQEVVESMDELLSTKSAIDLKEMQSQKLNRQL